MTALGLWLNLAGVTAGAARGYLWPFRCPAVGSAAGPGHVLGAETRKL